LRFGQTVLYGLPRKQQHKNAHDVTITRPPSLRAAKRRPIIYWFINNNANNNTTKVDSSNTIIDAVMAAEQGEGERALADDPLIDRPGPAANQNNGSWRQPVRVAHTLALGKARRIATLTYAGCFPLAHFDRVATDAVTLLHPPILYMNVRVHAAGRACSCRCGKERYVRTMHPLKGMTLSAFARNGNDDKYQERITNTPSRLQYRHFAHCAPWRWIKKKAVRTNLDEMMMYDFLLPTI
jgi:hypothetical protein